MSYSDDPAEPEIRETCPECGHDNIHHSFVWDGTDWFVGCEHDDCDVWERCL